MLVPGEPAELIEIDVAAGEDGSDARSRRQLDEPVQQRRDRVEHDHFRVWTFVPVLGIASCLLLLSQQSARVWLFGAVLIVVGVGLYFLARWARRRGERAQTASR